MLLNVLVGAMKNRGAVQLNRMPRMADFAMLITACGRLIGKPEARAEQRVVQEG
jgi:hypothetical protein